MLSHVRQTNILIRIDRVTKWLNKICKQYPVQIDINKIEDKINSIDLSWIIAICKMKFNCLSQIDFKKQILNSLAFNIHEDIITLLDSYHGTTELKPKFTNEPDFV